MRRKYKQKQKYKNVNCVDVTDLVEVARAARYTFYFYYSLLFMSLGVHHSERPTDRRKIPTCKFSGTCMHNILWQRPARSPSLGSGYSKHWLLVQSYMYS